MKSFLGPRDGMNCDYQWSGDYLRACLVSNVGLKRTNNEDSGTCCFPGEAESVDGVGFLFAVADGMGGASAGERASQLALQSLVKNYCGVVQWAPEPVPDASPDSFEDWAQQRAVFSTPVPVQSSEEHDTDVALWSIPSRLVHAVHRANGAVYEEAYSNPEYAGMGTTLSAVVVDGSWCYVAQVGDSRVYVLHGGRLQQVTEDHSLVAEQVRSGLLTEREARTHSLRNLITRAIGIANDVEPDLFCLPLCQGDTLLICSDGLSGMVSDAQIEGILSSDEDPKAAAEALIQHALEAGGVDNVTAITLRVTAQPPQTLVHDGARRFKPATKSWLGRLLGLFR